jgi:hypothetical protein
LPITDGGDIINAAVYVAGSDTIALKEIEKWNKQQLSGWSLS